MKTLDKNYIVNYGKTVEKIRKELENYLVDAKLKSIVIGISGGIDSALVAALAKPVCDKIGIPIIGRSISIVSNKIDEEMRADAIGAAFCHDYKHIDLSKEFYAMRDAAEPQGANESDVAYKIRCGNIKARLRMIKLYDLAQVNGGLVMSTDNLTELLMGFWTLHADVGDLGIIQQLWKTEVYNMSEYLCVNELKLHPSALYDCITCNATDGLGITSTDLDQLLPDWKERHDNTRSGYNEVDNILIDYIVDGKGTDGIIPTRMRKTEFKRDNPHNFTREQIVP